MGIEDFNIDTKGGYCDVIRHLRHDWKDRIPKKEYHSTTKINGDEKASKPFKVRNAWFHNVFGLLQIGVMNGYLPKSFKRIENSFNNYIEQNNLRRKLEIKNGEVKLGSPRKLTEKVDIDYGNNVLDMMIDELSPKENVFQTLISGLNQSALIYKQFVMDSCLSMKKFREMYSSVQA